MPALAQRADYEIHDSHFHLTNYIQEGTDIHRFLEIMGDTVGRVALFGIPLQQTWSYENSGEFRPTYYLQTDAPLYYYSFTDAYIAMAYRSLAPREQARFDPMITGFNPADMYGVDHIKRVLTTFPGVFTGIGEFTIHKEFVSSKVAGDTASLTDPALDRILDFAAESGLVVLLHNDIDMPFARAGAEPVYLSQTKDLLRRHANATIIWAHTGLGRVIRPAQSSASAERDRAKPRPPRYSRGDARRPRARARALRHLVGRGREVRRRDARGDAAHGRADQSPLDRFLFGTDEVAPPDQQQYLRVYRQYDPLWRALTPEAQALVKRGNYERLFDAARTRVRAWERANIR